MRRERAHLGDFVNLVRKIRPYLVALLHRAVFDAHKENNALVIIVITVEDERAQRRLGVAVGRRYALDHRFQNIADIRSFFRRNAGAAFRIQPDHLFDLFFGFLDLRRLQIDFIDDGHDFEIVFEREIHVGKRLRFDALRRVDG